MKICAGLFEVYLSDTKLMMDKPSLAIDCLRKSRTSVWLVKSGSVALPAKTTDIEMATEVAAIHIMLRKDSCMHY